MSKRDGKVVATLAAERNYSPVSITKRERFTLFAVRRMFDVFKGSPFLEDVRAVLSKLAQRMSNKERAEHATFGDRFVYLPDHGTKSYTGKDDIFNAIQTGLMSRKLVRYRYGDAHGRERDGYLAPFGLVMHRNGFYVIGARLKDVGSDVATAPRGMFAVERFAEAEHLRAHEFTVPPDFRMDETLHGAFGPHLGDPGGPYDVTVEFSAAKAIFVSSREWHPTQQTETLADGRVRVRFRVPHLASVVSWILEWGPHARAVGPDVLVATVKSELQEALAQYP